MFLCRILRKAILGCHLLTLGGLLGKGGKRCQVCFFLNWQQLRSFLISVQLFLEKYSENVNREQMLFVNMLPNIYMESRLCYWPPTTLFSRLHALCSSSRQQCMLHVQAHEKPIICWSFAVFGEGSFDVGDYLQGKQLETSFVLVLNVCCFLEQGVFNPFVHRICCRTSVPSVVFCSGLGLRDTTI